MTRIENIRKYYVDKKYKTEYKLENRTTVVEIRNSTRNISLKEKLWENLISRTEMGYSVKNITRKLNYKKLIGCNKTELYNHLENLLPKDLKMEDYPKWEIDHITPIASFNLVNENEQLICFNYKNLQPLLKFENRSKGKKCL